MIEAAFGQGEVVVSGQVEPDTYVVAKDGPASAPRPGRHAAFKIVRGPDGEDQRVELDPAEGGRRVLSDDEVVELARIGLAVEAHYGSPQDTEWAMAGGRTYLVQSRPVTAVGGAAAPAAAAEQGTLLVQGLAASAGRASGVVRVLQSPDQGDRLQAGEVLVAPMTSPDWVPTMRRAAAIVTDGGGMTCHAAIVSRELGVPAVVGARNATTVLRDGELVTVDGAQGAVDRGRRGPAAAARPTVGAAAQAGSGGPGALATRIYVNLAFAEHAEEVAALPVDGVGLLRAEFMVTDALGGVHPRMLLERGEEKTFVDDMAKSLLRITRAFEPRPVVYRSIDFRSNEFSNLEGGDQFEPHEENPMIGYRGCYRYVREPDLFRLELDVLARVLEETAEHRADDPLRAHGLGARGLPRRGRRQPGGRLPAGVGDGRGALGRLLDPDLRRHGDRRGVDRQQRPDPADARGRPRLADLRRRLRRGGPGRARCHRAHHRGLPGRRASPRRCAARPRRTGRPSPSTWSRQGITSISVNPDAVAAVRQTVAAAEWRHAARGRRARAAR